MHVLLDENLPHDLALLLTGHNVSTVQGPGGAGVKNGELLRRASGRIDVLLTMDRKLERQQKLTDLRVQDLQPLVADILAALPTIAAGVVRHVGAA